VKGQESIMDFLTETNLGDRVGETEGHQGQKLTDFMKFSLC
jgi:hypothetical protein